jgi:hypothetical protein
MSLVAIQIIKRKIYRGVIKRKLAEKNTKSFTALGRFKGWRNYVILLGPG